jgi:hypothetical protein
MLSLVLVSALAVNQARADVHPPGTIIEEAVVVDIPEEGFQDLTAGLSVLIPSQVDLGDIEQLNGDCGWLGSYAYGIEIQGLWVEIQILEAIITPMDGYLDLDITLEVMINDSSDKFDMTTHLICIEDTCEAYVQPFEAYVNTTIAMELVDDGAGGVAIDATVGDLAVDYDLEGADINLDSCAVGTIEDIFNFFGGSLYDLILPLVDPILQSQIQDMGPDIEEAIEDGFSSLSISEELEVEDVIIYLDLEPTDLDISPDGLRLVMGGSSVADEAAECIESYNTGGSLATPSEPPEIGSVSPAVSLVPSAAIHLADDFFNQLLYSLWEGGMLCYTIDEELTGFPLDTSILGLLAGDAFDALFQEDGALDIETLPRNPPVLNLESDHDLGVEITELGLDFSADLDHRMVRVLSMDLQVDAGVDMNLDDSTGVLGIDLDFGGESITSTVAYNEMVPNANADIEANFGSVFETLAGSLLGGLTGDLSFALPSYEGLGITALEMGTNGDERDWLGAYVEIGEVSYEGSGCDEDGGCTGGCEGGCSTPGRARGMLALWAFPLALFLLRRRVEQG